MRGLDSGSPNLGIVAGSSGVTCAAAVPEFVSRDFSTSPRQPAADESAIIQRHRRRVCDMSSLLTSRGIHSFRRIHLLSNAASIAESIEIFDSYKSANPR